MLFMLSFIYAECRLCFVSSVVGATIISRKTLSIMVECCYAVSFMLTVDYAVVIN